LLAQRNQDPGEYRVPVFRDSRLVGATLVGNTAIAPKLKKLIESQTNCAGLLAGASDAGEIRQAVGDLP